MALIGSDSRVRDFLEGVDAVFREFGFGIVYTDSKSSVLLALDRVFIFMTFFSALSQAAASYSGGGRLDSLFSHFNQLLGTRYTRDDCAKFPKVTGACVEGEQFQQYLCFCDLFYPVRYGMAPGFSEHDYLRVLRRALSAFLAMRTEKANFFQFLDSLVVAGQESRLGAFFEHLLVKPFDGVEKDRMVAVAPSLCARGVSAINGALSLLFMGWGQGASGAAASADHGL